MPRRAALRSALALALLAACTPSGEPEAERGEPSPAEERHRIEPEAPPRHLAGAWPDEPIAAWPDESSCGGLAVEPLGEWQREGARMDAVRRGWHPRAEHGRPVAIGEARLPFDVPGHRLWQVAVVGAPRKLAPCFMVDGEPPELPSFDACVPAWRLVGDVTPEARPKPAALTQLLGLLDGASVVYPDEAMLDRCMPGLPAEVRAAVPPLGPRRRDAALELAFVERIELGRGTAMLVAAHAKLASGQVRLEHRELWTFDREVAR